MSTAETPTPLSPKQSEQVRQARLNQIADSAPHVPATTDRRNLLDIVDSLLSTIDHYQALSTGRVEGRTPGTHIVDRLRSDLISRAYWVAKDGRLTEYESQIGSLAACVRAEALEEAAKVADERVAMAKSDLSADKEEQGSEYDPNCFGTGWDTGAREASLEIAESIRALVSP